MLTRLKLPIMIAAAAAVLVGAYFAYGMYFTSAPTGTVPVDPVVITDPFSINLADADSSAYVVMSLAVSIAPLPQAEHDLWTGAGAGGGHGGGSTEPPGPVELAKYPKLRDAVIEVTSTFTAEELTSEAGKARLKERLIAKFGQVHDIDEQKYKSMNKKGEVHNPVHPPYDIDGVYFQNIAVQP